MQAWFVFSMAVFFLWGSQGIFAKLSTPKLGLARVATLIIIVDGIMYALGFYFWHDILSFSLKDGLFAVISCMLAYLGNLSYFESIMDGQIAVAGTISAAYPALTATVAFFFLSETLTVTQAIILVAIVGGVVALSYDPNPGSEHAISRRSVFFALLAFAFWGFWGLTAKVAVDAVGPGNMFGFYVISSLTVPFLYKLFRKLRPLHPQNDKPSPIAWAFGAIALALNVCGSFAVSFAMKTGLASLVIPISGAYPLVTVLLAVTLLREKLNRFHMIGLVLVILGLMGIGSLLNQ